MAAINGEDLARMVRHWLATPVNGYLGSPYGSDKLALLQQPQASGLGDEFIDKMMTDIPALRMLPRGSVNVYFEETGNDSKRLLIQIGDIEIPYDEIRV